MADFQGDWQFHPLTPDPSPPFHGGEGRIVTSDQRSVVGRVTGGSPNRNFVARAFQPEHSTGGFDRLHGGFPG